MVVNSRNLRLISMAAVLISLITPGAAHTESAPPLPGLDDLLPIPGVTRPPDQPAPSETPQDAPGGKGRPPAIPGPLSSTPGPGRLWTLAGQTLTLHGLQVHGTRAATIDGRRLSTLHVSADRIDITTPVQRSRLANTSSVTRISADSARITPTRADQRIELEITQIGGTLVLAGQPAVPVLLAAPPLAIELPPVALGMPELTLTDAHAQVLALTNGDLTMPGAVVTAAGPMR